MVIHQELKTRINTIFLSHNYLSYLVNNLKEILDYYEMKKIHNIQLPIASSGTPIAGTLCRLKQASQIPHQQALLLLLLLH